MSQPSTISTSRVTARLARNRLGVASLVAFTLTAATPVTVYAGVTTTGWAMTGVVGISVAFAAIGLILALFAVGYTTMARYITNAGAFYAFIARAWRPAGIGAAWVALASYMALSLGLYGLMGVAATPLIESWTGLEVAWWVPAGVCWLIVAILGVQAVDINGRVLMAILALEILVIAVFSAANLANPAAGGLTLDALAPSALFEPGAGALLILGLLGCVGFEAATVYAEEARDPSRTVMRATFISVAILAVLYTLASWAVTVAVGPDQVVAAAAEQEIGLVFGLAAANIGSTVASIAEVLLVTSVLAAMLSFHNTVARYAFSLGRERVLPAVLGQTSARTAAPVNASIVQSAIAAAVLIVYITAGLDPLVHLFYYAGTAGGLGVLLLLTATAVAVVLFFVLDRRGESTWRARVAPIASVLVLFAVTGIALAEFDLLLGAPPGSALPAVIPLVYVALAVAGIVWGLALAARRPGIYAQIGTGPKAVLGDTTAAAVPVAGGRS